MSDYGRLYRTYGGNVVDVQLPTAEPLLIEAASTTKRICLLEATFTPSEYTTCVLAFVDSVTNEIVGTITVPDGGPGVVEGSNQFVLKWGPSGAKLSAGANLLLSIVSGGAAGRLHIEACQKHN